MAMSGGVDSTISTLMLQEQGYEVEGVYMRLHQKPGYHEVHQNRAQKAADFAGVKLHILDLEARFNEVVYQPFVDIYAKGETPNPCALCNKNIKFGALVDFAKSLGADALATGHYVQHDGRYLLEASDEQKDQSYFLFNINKDVVPFLLFPLGGLLKTDIKARAASINGLESFASQAESSEICFVDKSYVDVLAKHHDVDRPGDVLNESGEVIGTHQGYMHYTIGKRKGFRIDGAHDPHYVTKIVPQRNQIVVGSREALQCSSVQLRDINMFHEATSFEAWVKLRYKTKPVQCRVDINGTTATVRLFEPVYGVANGQAAVFYLEGRVLGGGWIAATYK